MVQAKSSWIADNLHWVVPLLFSFIVGVAGWFLAELKSLERDVQDKHSRLNEFAIRHDERIAANERGDATRDIKIDQILAKVSNVETLTIKLSSDKENRDRQESHK